MKKVIKILATVILILVLSGWTSAPTYNFQAIATYDCDFETVKPNNCENGNPTVYHWNRYYGTMTMTRIMELMNSLTDPNITDQNIGDYIVYHPIEEYLKCRSTIYFQIYSGDIIITSIFWQRGDPVIGNSPPSMPIKEYIEQYKNHGN